MNSENNTRKRVPKPVKRRQKAKRVGSGFVLLILAVVLAIGGTLAYIIANTEEVKNKFTPGEVRCEVVEQFEKPYKVKSDVKIKNTGNTAAYIRATYVVTWQKDDGTVNGKMPVVGTDYTIDVEKLKQKLQTEQYGILVATHIYGHRYNEKIIRDLCNRYHIILFEDVKYQLEVEIFDLKLIIKFTICY